MASGYLANGVELIAGRTINSFDPHCEKEKRMKTRGALGLDIVNRLQRLTAYTG